MMCAVLAIAVVAPSIARAQAAPAGWIWDVNSVNPGTVGSYTDFTTSFVADNTSEYVSFAFRETPAFWAFDDPSVVNGTTGSSLNLLADPTFAGSTYGQNCDHGNSLGCPPGWGAWIEAVDVSFIGQIATSTSPYDCPIGPSTGTNFWCDGSVQGYDALYQDLTGLIVGDTYDISFYLQDNSGQSTTSATSANCTVSGDSCIDALVYAGDSLPIGSIPIGATPEPSSFIMLGTGMFGLVTAYRGRRGRKA
jgi:hypothetical protein